MSGLKRKFKGRDIIAQNRNVILAVDALMDRAAEIDAKMPSPVVVDHLVGLRKAASEWIEFIDPRKSYELTINEAKECHAFPRLTAQTVYDNLNDAFTELSGRQVAKGLRKVDDIIEQYASELLVPAATSGEPN